MREHVYVPDRIANAETEYAVNALSYWMFRDGVCEFDDAKERICRLLGWMCEKAGGRKLKRKTEAERNCDASISAQFGPYRDDDASALKELEDWWYTRHKFPCGHVIEVTGPSNMRQPEVCPICGNAEEEK